jgi:Tol biopolymer transport system component
VTTKVNSPANYLHSNSAWSPTGSYIAFIASRNGDWTTCQVYKIAANGKGKAIRLTADQDGYAGLRWRP